MRAVTVKSFPLREKHIVLRFLARSETVILWNGIITTALTVIVNL